LPVRTGEAGDLPRCVDGARSESGPVGEVLRVAEALAIPEEAVLGVVAVVGCAPLRERADDLAGNVDGERLEESGWVPPGWRSAAGVTGGGESRKACRKFAVIADPTIWPESLIPKASPVRSPEPKGFRAFGRPFS